MNKTAGYSVQIHGVRKIEIGDVTDLSADNDRLESPMYSIRMTIPMQAHDTCPTMVTFFSGDPHAFDGLADNIHAAARRLAGGISDDEQSALDQSPPHPMKKD